MNYLIASLLICCTISAEAFAVETQAACVLRGLREGKLELYAIDNIDPARINYRLLGAQNKETIVLIHGLGGNLDTWYKVAPELAKKYRVLIYDQRGHGLTYAPSHNFSSATMATDLKMLMDKLGIQQAHVLGHSMGGRTAMRFADLYPDRVRSVMVEDMHMIGRRTPMPDQTEYAKFLMDLSGRRFGTPAAASAYVKKTYFFEPTEKNLKDWGFGKDTRNGDWVFNARPYSVFYGPQGLQEDLTKALQNNKKPTLFLAADRKQEPVLFEKGIDHVRENSPGAEVVVIPGAHHGIHDSQYKQFMNEVQRFVEQNRGAQ